MAEWWLSLSLTSQIYFCIAIAGTVALLVQSILLFFGVGESAEPGDFDGSFDGEGLGLFTMRGIISFLAIGGWVGMWLSTTLMELWLVIIISLVAGLAAMFTIALIMKGFMRMQSSGTMQLSCAIGKTATVYLRVPAKDGGNGKVTMTLSGKFMELDAISNDENEYAVSTIVKIIGLIDDTVIVTSIDHVKTDSQTN